MSEVSGNRPCARHSPAKRSSVLPYLNCSVVSMTPWLGVLAGRLCSLLNIWTPDVVMTLVGRRRNADIQLLCRRLRKDVGVKSLLVIKSSPDFIGHRKYERAAAIAARFPEVGWKLPAKRK